MKRRNITRLFTALLIVSLMLSVLPLAVSAQESELITTRSEFEKALNSAKDGDTLLVGDIDFNLQGEGAVNEAERITIAKNITIKNGKTDGKAVFNGASFLLGGTNVAGKTSDFSFIGITFDEGLNADEITNTDWNLSYYGDGSLISGTPLKCQRAINCFGNTNAQFYDCEFKNYMSVEGGAIYAWYLDGDNSHCSLNITLDGCTFESNSALNSGGAIYLRAKNNVTLSAVDCTFTDNRSGFNDQATGGGAVALYDCKSEFENCEFKDNVGNHFYGGDRFFDFGYVPEMGGNFIVYEDALKGGAVFACDGEISMRNCILTENSASYGGAIALQTITADIEDCLITNNRAVSVLEEAYKNKYLGVGSCNGLGGAIYIDGAKCITIGNTEIADNFADSAYGAIYTTFVTWDPEFYEQFELNFLFCSIRDNTCGVKISEIQGDTGTWLYDTHTIPYVNTYGCLVLDEIYKEDIPRTEQPTEENGYNYFGSTAPSEWYNDEGHLVHAPTVSTDFIKEKLGDKNYYGTFTVGANNHDVTFRFFADGECKHTVTVPSGVIPTLPDLLKTGYTLTSWTLGEKTNYDQGSPLVVGNETENVDIYAVYTPNTYKVTFDFGYNQTEVTQTFGEALSLPEAIERTGYTFVGWFTLADGEGEKLTDGANFMTAENVTYYAFYEPVAVTPPSEFPTVPVIIVSVVILLIAGGAVCFIILRRKKAQQAEKEAAEASAAAVTIVAPTEPRIVKTRYTDEEIDRIIEGTKEAQMLTDRELEVFRELLKGKKQSEIGYRLGITVNTVKDYAGRVYAKLGVSNKNALFELIDSKMSKK